VSDAPRILVGLMSGTSLDGISAAIVRFDDAKGAVTAELLGFHVREYTPAQRARLGAAMTGVSPAEYCRLDFEFGEWLGQAAVEVIAEAGIARADIAAIASHGQTVWHEPGHSTWQLGEPAVIAERTGLPVIADFRTRDMAAGGQGAPLVPIADALLFASSTVWRAIQNIGGIGNVTVVPPREAPRSASGDGAALEGVRAFDTGPGMVIVNGVTSRLTGGSLAYDRDAVLSRAGDPITEVVAESLGEPYYALEPPKSTGRELYTPAYIDSFIDRCRARRESATTEDIVATAVHLTAATIADAYGRFIPEPVTEVLLCGGGSKHPLLADLLGERLYPATVQNFDELYFDAEAKEAVAFALMGWLHLRHKPGNVPSATGARGGRILGAYTPA
jgi:anhydro-N-acetylmuramic acid kinase